MGQGISLRLAIRLLFGAKSTRKLEDKTEEKN